MKQTMRAIQKIALRACCALFCVAFLAALPARAQFIGYQLPQTVQSTPFNNVACTGSAQLVAIKNLGQIAHYLTLQAGSPPPVGISVVLLGSWDGVNFVTLSDSATNVTFVGGMTSVVGSGYYPILEVQALCSSALGNFTVNYSGSGGTPGPILGAGLFSQVDKLITGAGANTGTGTDDRILQTPYGSAGGYLNYVALGTVPTGATLTVQCDSGLTAQQANSYIETFTLVNTPLPQVFPVPSWPCGFAEVLYARASGGGSSTFTLHYSFSPPGTQGKPAAYPVHITGTTATAVKATSGFLDHIIFGTPAAGTVTVFDLGTGDCTGTPSTNVKSVLTATVAQVLQSVPFDAFFQNGICIKASVAMDLTAVYQ